jgi:pyocin large subunit-like protein
MNRRGWLLATFFTILVLPLPARGERAWDAELKRYLTEQEMTHAEVFLTHKDAVFKFSYMFNNQKDTSISNFVNNPRNSQTTRIDGNGFLFIAATYF